MEIIKNLHDLSFPDAEKEFMSYLHESIGSYAVIEKIKNKNYIKKYVKPINDLFLYNYVSPGQKVDSLLKNS